MARITAKNSLRNDNCCRMVVRNRRVCSSTGSSSMSQLSIRSLPPLLAASFTPYPSRFSPENGQLAETQHTVNLKDAVKPLPVMFQNFVADQLRIGVYGGETRLFNSLNKMNQNSNANGPDLLHKGDSKMERDVHDAVTLVTNMPKAVNKIFVAKSSIEQAMTNLNWASGTELIDDPPIEGNLQEQKNRLTNLRGRLTMVGNVNDAEAKMTTLNNTIEVLEAQDGEDGSDSNIFTAAMDNIGDKIGDEDHLDLRNLRDWLKKCINNRKDLGQKYKTLKTLLGDFKTFVSQLSQCDKIADWELGSCCSLQGARDFCGSLNLAATKTKWDELRATMEAMERERRQLIDGANVDIDLKLAGLKAAALQRLGELGDNLAANQPALQALLATLQEAAANNICTKLVRSTENWIGNFNAFTQAWRELNDYFRILDEKLVILEELRVKVDEIITLQIHQGYQLFKQWPTKLKLFVNEYSRINRLDAESQEEIKRMVMFCITSAIGGNAPPAVEDSKPDVFDVAVYTCTKLDEMMNTNMVDEVLEALKLRYTSMAELEVLKKFKAMNLCERIEKPITMVNKK